MSLAGPMPLDPRAFLGDEDVRMMTEREAWCYLRLLFHQWEEGSIPRDPRRLAAILTEGPRSISVVDIVGEDPEAPLEAPLEGTLEAPLQGGLWGSLKPCFTECDDAPGRLRNPKCHALREEWVAKKESMQRGGRKGGRKSAKVRGTKELMEASPPSSPPSRGGSPSSTLTPASSTTPKDPPIVPPGGCDSVAHPEPDWARKAAKGTKEKAGDLREAVCRCIGAVRLEAPDPERAKTSAAPILALWRALGKPGLATFSEEFCSVANAAHHCQDPVFARDIRAEGWPDGVDRSHDVATVAVQKRWDERLAVARSWLMERLRDPPRPAHREDAEIERLRDAAFDARNVYGDGSEEAALAERALLERL